MQACCLLMHMHHFQVASGITTDMPALPGNDGSTLSSGVGTPRVAPNTTQKYCNVWGTQTPKNYWKEAQQLFKGRCGLQPSAHEPKPGKVQHGLLFGFAKVANKDRKKTVLEKQPGVKPMEGKLWNMICFMVGFFKKYIYICKWVIRTMAHLPCFPVCFQAQYMVLIRHWC